MAESRTRSSVLQWVTMKVVKKVICSSLWNFENSFIMPIVSVEFKRQNKSDCQQFNSKLVRFSFEFAVVNAPRGANRRPSLLRNVGRAVMFPGRCTEIRSSRKSYFRERERNLWLFYD
ncbi:hypothetical protein KIN20_002611 [Parelaphostrongylus tenuis]|uniref:Uncharacterized protein n=1 Tax=Parelaphostrongylus tenuis TaxID=148309 RepID=A0AAD5MNU3_PARTN|nr:hypothetical protein KIN20_002611 [Parelaphostrongylus tenuis]